MQILFNNDINQLMKQFSQKIKNQFDVKYQELEKQIRKATSIFNPNVALYSQQQLQNICSLIKKTKSNQNLKRNLKLLLDKMLKCRQWVSQVKNQVTLFNLIRKFDITIIPFVYQYLKSYECVENKIEAKKQYENIKYQIRCHVILNLKTYLEKLCQNLQLYHQIRSGKQNWEPISNAHNLFKIINIITYLLATKNTIYKIFKNFDTVQMFLILTKLIIEDLNLWYEYYVTKLNELLQSLEELQKNQLQIFQQLIYWADKNISKINQYNMIPILYGLDICIQPLANIKLPPHTKAKFQVNLLQPKQNLKNNSFIQKIIKIDSNDRKFTQDIVQKMIFKEDDIKQKKNIKKQEYFISKISSDEQ